MPDELMTKAEVEAIAIDKREFPSIVRLARTALRWQAEAENLRDSVQHWRTKAMCYGNIVHGCSPALEEAGFPVDSSGTDGAVGGIRRAVESLALARAIARDEAERMQSDHRDRCEEAAQRLARLQDECDSLREERDELMKENERLQADVSARANRELDQLCEIAAIKVENERLQRKLEAACEEGKRLREVVEKLPQGARSCPFDCPLGLNG